MSYLDLTIKEMHQALLEGKVTPLELTKEALKRAKEDTNNAFEYICEKEAFKAVNNLDESKKNNPLWGIPFVLKDNYSTKDIPTTGSSNILKEYVPVFSSEVYNRLVEQGAIIIGKVTLDELAMGGSGINGHKGITFNPWDKTHTHIVGGSSSGSAAAVSAGIVPLGIGSDTGDSVRKPANHAGLVGFKPSWGRISRFGLFPFAPSLDHVAFLTRSVEDSAIALEALAGRDIKDATSSEKPVEKYFANLKEEIKGIKIAIIDEIINSITNRAILNEYQKTIESLRNAGAIINHVSIEERLCKAIYPTYIVISCAESTSSNANLDGIKFGERAEGKTYEEVMTKSRTQGFSELTKRRFIIGGYALRSENQKDTFLRAQKCRRLIVEKTNEILKDNDIILLPAAPSTAPLLEGRNINKLSNEYLIADSYLAIGNFAGLPSLTLPIGFENGLPFGANLTGRAFEEQKVLNIALAIENITGLKNIMPKEGR